MRSVVETHLNNQVQFQMYDFMVRNMLLQVVWGLQPSEPQIYF